MKRLCIGVDPSINSTGLVVRMIENDVEKYVHFYIIKNDNHELTKKGEKKSPLTKKELKAQEKNDNFDYILYDKWYGDNEASSYEREMKKTMSLMSIGEKVSEVIKNECIKHECNSVTGCIEGISYGSSGHTTAIYDLAGLNYLLRRVLLEVCEDIVVAPPGHVKKFATGNGAAYKNTMIALFEGIYPDLDIPKNDDIADAYFMSLIAERELQ